MAKIWIEVAYAEAQQQLIKPLQVEQGTSLYEAAKLANMEATFPNLNLEQVKMGVFSKLSAKPKEQVVEEGQRIEIYRPLALDPKQIRIKRAQKQQNSD